MRHPELLTAGRAALVVVDVQERLEPHMADHAHVPRIAALIDGFRLLDLPILATEQYPQGLGPTLPELAGRLPQPALVKSSFSCAADSGFRAALEATGARQVLVTGTEAHVCVLQTALDLLHAGLQVHVAYDAVASRRAADRAVALQRLERAGAIVTATESVLFELLECSGTDRFRAISRIVKAIG